MKVFVTGGAGYLGSLLIPHLLANGDDVVVLDNLMWGAQALFPVLGDRKLEVVKGDVRDERVVAPLIKSADVVVNLAAIVGFPACAAHPLDARSTNLDAVRGIAGQMSPGQLLIQASTGSTYGAVDDVCTEDTPINPLTLYGETKAEAEKPVLDGGGIALRFATVFGLSPRMRLDLLVNDIVHQAVRFGTFVMYEGHARRTFLHSTDAVRSILFAIENQERMRGQPFNVGDEDLNYTKAEIAHMIKAQHDYYLHEAAVGEDKDKRDYAVSYARINALGYRALVNMTDGIAELIRVVPLIAERSAFRNYG